MDKAFRQMLLSDKSESKKLSYVRDFVLARENTLHLTPLVFNNMMKCCIDFMVEDQSSLSFELARTIFSELAMGNRQLFSTYFEPLLVDYLLRTNDFSYADDAVWILNTGLGIIHHYQSVCYGHLCLSVQQQVTKFVSDKSNDSQVVIKLCELLLDHPDCIPTDQVMFCQVVLVATTKWTRTPADYDSYVHAVRSYVGTLLKIIWNSNPKAAQESVLVIFEIIFNQGSHTLALGCVVQFIPNKAICDEISQVAKSHNLGDVVIINALCHMTDWLLLPLNENIDRWIVFFIRSLAQQNKLGVLMRVSELQTPLVCISFSRGFTRIQLE